jgi:hypothetical protein
LSGGHTIGKPIANIDSIDISKHYTGAYGFTIRGTLVYPDPNLGAFPDPNAFAIFDAAADLRPVAVAIIERQPNPDSNAYVEPDALPPTNRPSHF